jgi:glycosyltransferase involved in cell wall biosynthesis
MFVIVISWNRPKFLRRTLDSLFWFTSSHDKVCVVDNGSHEDTQRVVNSDCRLHERYVLPKNLGINGALEHVMRTSPIYPAEKYILVSDGDMLYNRPLSDAERFLEAHGSTNSRQFDVLSLHDSPEHKKHGSFRFQDEIYLEKRAERGCSLVFRRELLEQLRPLPVHKLTDFDWWVFRDSPRHINKVAVMPMGSLHLGWRAEDSTWNPLSVDEYVKL